MPTATMPIATAPTATPTPTAPTPAPSALARAADSTVPLDQRWRILVESVRAARKAGAASALEHAVPISIAKAGIVVGFRKGDGRALILQDKDTRGSVEGAFEKALGYRAPLSLVEVDAPKDDSLAEQKQKARADRSSQRIALARAHPAVRAAVELLGGELEDVKDIGED
jgi:hypothetical protein